MCAKTAKIKKLPRFKAGTDSEKFFFFQIPKILVTDDYYKKLSNDAKLLYAILLDRMNLSLQYKNINHFSNADGDVFIIYSIEELAKVLNKGKTSVIKYMNELEDFGLIEREKVPGSFNQANRIYVLNFSEFDIKDHSGESYTSTKNTNVKNEHLPVDNFNDNDAIIEEIPEKTVESVEISQGSQSEPSRVHNPVLRESTIRSFESSQSGPSRVHNLDPNNIKKTISNKTNQIISNQESDDDDGFEFLFKKNVELDILTDVIELPDSDPKTLALTRREAAQYKDMADSIIDAYRQSMIFNINGQRVDKKKVRERLLRVTSITFCEARRRLNENKNNVERHGLYLVAMLYQMVAAESLEA